MSELVAPEPEHCPGTQSEDAGKASACDGCPNKQICASSTPKAPDPDIQVIADRLKNVKRKILILSGKGGVGKSTLTAMLARALANSDENINVGVLDIDLCGPSCPRVFGVANEQGNFTRKHKLYNLTRIRNSEMEFPFSGKNRSSPKFWFLCLYILLKSCSNSKNSSLILEFKILIF